MSISETYSGLYEFFHGDLYATVELKDTGDGWVAEFFVSRNLLNDLGVELLGYVRVPVYGEFKDDAVRRLGFIHEDVTNFLGAVAGGFGSVGAGNDVSGARKHCKAHLQMWNDVVGGTKTGRTATMYLLAVDFGVNNPAALIAEVEVLPSVRTVHDRLAHARRIGLLDSYGKGRIRSGGDSSAEDEEGSGGGAEGGFDIFAKTELGFKHRNSSGEWV
jgi:hypothetical protein